MKGLEALKILTNDNVKFEVKGVKNELINIIEKELKALEIVLSKIETGNDGYFIDCGFDDKENELLKEVLNK